MVLLLFATGLCFRPAVFVSGSLVLVIIFIGNSCVGTPWKHWSSYLYSCCWRKHAAVDGWAEFHVLFSKNNRKSTNRQK